MRLSETAERRRLLQVSGTFFDVLGIRATVGRLIAPSDTAVGAAPVVLVSQRIWERSLGSDPSVLGRPMMVNDEPRTIVGVVPAAFSGLDLGAGADVVTPIVGRPQTAAERGSRRFSVVGRLRAGRSLADAQTELSTIAARLARAYPDTNLGTLSQPDKPRAIIAVRHARLDPSFRAEVALVSAILMGAVLLVLLITCANIAGLLLSRASSREREVAVRVALGASRGDLLRQFLTESIVLGAAGGASGLLLALWTADVLPSFFPAEQQELLNAHVDAGVLAFTMALALASGLLFGLAPALQLLRRSPLETLRGTGAVAPAGRARLRVALVVCQLALAVVLLVSATLLVRSLDNSLHADLGFSLREAAVATLEQPATRTPAQGLAYFDRLLDRLRTTPGVRAATLTSALPLSGRQRRGFRAEGYEPRSGEDRELHVVTVEASYFTTLGIPILEGRAFDARDRTGGAPVAIVNEAVARRYFTGSAVGRHLTDSRRTTLEIVGVVPTGKRLTVQDDSVPVVYYPLSQDYRGRLHVVASLAGPSASAVETVRTQATDTDHDVAVYRAMTLTSHLSESMATDRLTAALVGACGLIALVLAVTGVYGVIAFAVARRTPEIGVRLALGARPAQILRLVMRESAIMSAVGLGVGLLAASGATRLLASVLYGVGASDVPTFAGVAAALAVITMLAVLLPARRALAIDPVVALRRE